MSYLSHTDLVIGAETYNDVATKIAFFHGLIDEVQVYGRALDATEIQAIYDAAGAGVCKGNNILDSAGGGSIA